MEAIGHWLPHALESWGCWVEAAARTRRLRNAAAELPGAARVMPKAARLPPATARADRLGQRRGIQGRRRQQS